MPAKQIQKARIKSIRRGVNRDIRNPEGYTFVEWKKEVDEELTNSWRLTTDDLERFDARKAWRGGVPIEKAVKIAMGADNFPDEEIPSLEDYFFDDYVEDVDLPYWLQPRG